MKLSDLPKLKPLIEAVERGETIQRRDVNLCWRDIDDPDTTILGDDILRYRIKPKPRECHIPQHIFNQYYTQGCGEISRVKVREVEDD